MGASISANHGNHCFINSKRGDSHPIHNSNPTRTCTYIHPPPPLPAGLLPAPYGHTTSYWLCRFPTPTQPGINPPHNPSTDILHSPAYEDGTDSEFRNVGNYNSDAGELSKKEHITFRTRRKFKNKISHRQSYINAHKIESPNYSNMMEQVQGAKFRLGSCCSAHFLVNFRSMIYISLDIGKYTKIWNWHGAQSLLFMKNRHCIIT